VPGELVQLHEGALVEKETDALTRRQFALGVLLLDRTRGTGVRGLLDPALQVRELARGGVQLGVGGVVAFSGADIGMRLPAWSRGVDGRRPAP